MGGGAWGTKRPTRRPSPKREGRQIHDLAARHRGLMGAEAHAGPVGGLNGVREGLALAGKRGGELMREMRNRLGTTFLISTHDPQVAALAERMLMMRDGLLCDA